MASRALVWPLFSIFAALTTAIGIEAKSSGRAMREPVTTISWSSLLGGVFWAWAWALAVVAHAIAQMQVAVEAIDFWMLAFMLGSPFTGFERERGQSQARSQI
jgi:hypothetical protein